MTEKSAAALHELVGTCRQRLEDDLCELMEELGPALIEEAAALAATSDDEARRSSYLDLRRSLGDRWQALTPALRQALSLRTGKSPGPEAGAGFGENLHILSDDDMAVQFTAREVLGRISTACSEETGALDRRISYLALRNAMQRSDATFRLASLFGCIDRSCADIFPEAGQRILLLPMLGRHLEAELPQIYRATNESLIDADILPRLKRSYRDFSLVDPATAAAESARITSALERLVRTRAAAAGAPADADAGAARLALLDSLNTLQATPALSANGAHTNLVRLARDSAAARNVRPVEAVTLDVVADLFDLIFGDQSVAEGIKALVARLQTPVLKVAMLNQQFFADRNHPARRFLDSISAIAIRWGKVVNASDPFYRKLSELVDRIRHTYDGDVAVFEAANTELNDFLAEREEIEAEQARILAEAVRAREEEMRIQREGQLLAQKAADQQLARFITPDIPSEIEQFLHTYWRDVLQARIFASGPDSTSSAEALQVASELVWTVAPKTKPEDRQRQAAALPALLKRLHTGFDEIGATESERSAFMDTLVDLQLSALRAKKRGTPEPGPGEARKPRPAGGSPTLQVSHATKSGVRVQDISLPQTGDLGAENTPDSGTLRRVRQLVRGDWVDFITAGQARRERVTWINHGRTLFLFSNSASECAISITPEALAVRLTNQTARLVRPDTPIFERALHGAVQSMDKQA
ncbi:MAG: DUF1631 family protein [Sulfuritalea sp.]|jgi:hypothetical protein|nr:DUF1631 family protein [Sulfuritalea sp.]